MRIQMRMTVDAGIASCVALSWDCSCFCFLCGSQFYGITRREGGRREIRHEMSSQVSNSHAATALQDKCLRSTESNRNFFLQASEKLKTQGAVPDFDESTISLIRYRGLPPCRSTDLSGFEPRFRLDTSARAFKINEYLFTTMDKYAPRVKIRKHINLAYSKKCNGSQT